MFKLAKIAIVALFVLTTAACSTTGARTSGRGWYTVENGKPVWKTYRSERVGPPLTKGSIYTLNR